jgi:hypothetical protein
MKHRCYDIVVENDNGEANVPDEYVLDLPEHNATTAVDRQEFLGIMLDTLVASSGLNVCSFRSEEVVA